MRWLVCIDTSGVTAKLAAGENDRAIKKCNEEIKSLKDENMKIVFLFEKEKIPAENNREFTEFSKTFKNRIYKKYGFDAANSFGYDMRKRYLGNDYIEVMAELDTEFDPMDPNDIYREFHEQYQGLEGAMEILSHTRKIMSSCPGDPGKYLEKWMRKLELEAEE